MGGFGSGPRSGKDLADEMWRLDVRPMERGGYLKAGISYGWKWGRGHEIFAFINVVVESERIWLSYRQREQCGEWMCMNYPVGISRTACTYGGKRTWWLCPMPGCGRRVAVLFGGAVFACRYCHRLAYRSQRETASDRASRRVDFLRERLGWDPGILSRSGRKPKGMHWRTFDRLVAKHDVQVTKSISSMMEKFEVRLDSLD